MKIQFLTSSQKKIFCTHAQKCQNRRKDSTRWPLNRFLFHPRGAPKGPRQDASTPPEQPNFYSTCRAAAFFKASNTMPPLLALGSGKIDTLFTPPGGALFRAFIHHHRGFFLKVCGTLFNRDSILFLCFMYNRTFWHQQQQNNTQSTFSAGDCMCKCVSMCCHFRSQCEIFKCFQFS